MRFSVVLRVSLAASFSHAANKLVCRELTGERLNSCCELSPDNQAPLNRSGGLIEGEAYLFRMEIYTQDPAIPDRSFEGIVETEDVMFFIQRRRRESGSDGLYG